MMSEAIEADGRTGRVAAIYARVFSERQRQDETIQSQTVENDDLRWPHRDGLIWPHFSSVVVGLDVA